MYALFQDVEHSSYLHIAFHIILQHRNISLVYAIMNDRHEHD